MVRVVGAAVALWLVAAVGLSQPLDTAAAAAPSRAGSSSASTASDGSGDARAASASPAWHAQLDRYVAGKDVGVSVRLDGTALYNHEAARQRVPASNQKLLLTMALFERVDPESTIRTNALGNRTSTTTVSGDLWLVGWGDPTVTAGGVYGDRLPFEPARLGRLARRIKASGVTRITGSVKVAKSPFSRDWWAKGWRSHYRANYIPLPTGLSLDGNTAGGRHITNPELRAARVLTDSLRRQGVRIGSTAGVGWRPAGLDRVAAVESAPLVTLARYMNRRSANFFAEMLGKRLAVLSGRRPGSIAGGAAAVREWATSRGVAVTAHDASGLSYANRISSANLARLLDDQARTPRFAAVRSTLPAGGQGTLQDRLRGVRLRAKTGTLRGYSALSGYVYLDKRGRWASFSILSQGMSKSSAAAMEDRIVRWLEQSAR